MADPKWRQSAACRGAPLGLFYGPLEGPLREDYDDAQALCSQCGVKDECLTDAMEISDWWSYRAGMSPMERLMEWDGRYDDRPPEEAARLYRRLLGRLRGSVAAAVPEASVNANG